MCKNQGQQRKEAAGSSGELEELKSGKARKAISNPACFEAGAGILHWNCCGLGVIKMS